jgi:hypothetical protein
MRGFVIRCKGCGENIPAPVKLYLRNRSPQGVLSALNTEGICLQRSSRADCLISS